MMNDTEIWSIFSKIFQNNGIRELCKKSVLFWHIVDEDRIKIKLLLKCFHSPIFISMVTLGL